MARYYAQWMGLAIVAIGIAGLALGEQSFLQLINIDLAEDMVHLLTGGLMAYVGFANRDMASVQIVVGGIGVAYLLVGVLGFMTPTLFGLLPHGYSLFDNMLHLLLGVAGIVVAWFVESGQLRDGFAMSR